MKFEQAPVPEVDLAQSNESAVKLAVFEEIGGDEVAPYFAEDVVPPQGAFTSPRTSGMSRAATSRNAFAARI